jgi:hypothetical protein
MLPAKMDGMEAMKLSRGERARPSSQIAAQSRENIGLNDNQMSATLYCFFSLACDRAALHSSEQLCAAAG